MEAHTHRLWQHRFSRIGPYKERWQGLFVPLTAETGLADVHCTWNGVFVAEAIAALRPAWHLLLSDTDVAPTALFEVGELVQLCEQICHNSLQAGQPGLIVGTEPHQDINAGLAIFPGTARLPTAKGYDCTCWSGLGFPYHSSRLRPHPPTLSTRSSCKPLPLPSCMQSTSILQRSLAPRSLAFSHKTLTTTLQPGSSSAHGPVPWCGPHLNAPSGQRPAVPSTNNSGSGSPT